MRGETAAAIGLSLGLHAGLLTMVAIHAVSPRDMASSPSVTVSFDAPASPLGHATPTTPPDVAATEAGPPAAAVSSAAAPLAPLPAQPPLLPAQTLAASAPPAVQPTSAPTPPALLQETTPSSDAVPAKQPLEAQQPSVPEAKTHDGLPNERTERELASVAAPAPEPTSRAATAAEPLVARPTPAASASLTPAPTLPQAPIAAAPVPSSPEPSAILMGGGGGVPPVQPAAPNTVPAAQPPEVAKPERQAPAIASGAAAADEVAAVTEQGSSVSALPNPAAAAALSSPAAIVPAPAPMVASTAASAVGPVPDAGVTAPPSLAQPPGPAEVPAALAAAPLTEIPSRLAEAGMQASPDLLLDVARIRRMRQFISDYDGGPCFFAAADWISGRGAAIESFSAASDKFRTFDTAFKASTGLEAAVSGQRVWSAQCSAVEYLRQVTPGDGVAATLELDRRSVRSGDTLSGTVHEAGQRHLALFVVSETGAVQNVSASLTAREDVTTFSIPVVHATAGGPFPQILVLVASTAAVPDRPTTVGDLFKPILADKADEVLVAAKLFLVSR